MPFSTPSLQAGGAQAEEVQTPDWQSEPTSQGVVSGQGAQLPPQSTAVSSPFCWESLQVGGTHSWARQISLPVQPVPKGQALQ